MIRHAHAECTSNGQPLLCGRYDSSLSPLGKFQVTALARRLAGEPQAAAVYSSPLRRTLATARSVPEPLYSALRRLNSLAEINCGWLDGMPLATVRRDYPDVWHGNTAQQDPEFQWPGGESYTRFRHRVLRVLCSLGRTHLGSKILVFTHAGVINQAIGAIVGQTAARWENYRPGNASITELLFNGQRFELVRFDDCAHLSAASMHQLA